MGTVMVRVRVRVRVMVMVRVRVSVRVRVRVMLHAQRGRHALTPHTMRNTPHTNAVH